MRGPGKTELCSKCYGICRVSELRSDPSHAPQTPKVVTIAAAHAAHDTYSAFLPPLLPVFIEKLSLAKAEAGLLTVFLQGPSLLHPFIGHLGDRFDLRVIVVLTPAVTAACMSLLGVAPNYAVIALLLVTAGVSAAVLHSLAPVIAGRLSRHRLGYGMGFWMVGGELGRTLGPIILVSAIAVLGLEGLPWLMVGGVGASALRYFGVRGTTQGPGGGGQLLPGRAIDAEPATSPFRRRDFSILHDGGLRHLPPRLSARGGSQSVVRRSIPVRPRGGWGDRRPGRRFGQ